MRNIFKQIIVLMGLLSFFGSKSQNKSNNYKILTSDLKTELKNKLKDDSDYTKTSDLENKIINTYGFEGIKLLFEYRNSSNYYELGNFPKDCPWINLNNKNITDFISLNFKAIDKKIPQLVSSLKERCKFIYAEKKENTWYLHYLLNMKLYDNRDYYRIYTGGSPLLNPIPNDNLQTYNWEIPNDLKELYKIHNGFGEIFDANFVLSNEEIKVMAEMMKPICKEQNVKPEGYSFENLLEFFPDGAGNAQCFYKTQNDITTVDWDHEVWGISWEIGFFEFINERMSEIDEE